ncbi:MarR family winged helix-turn-helix transcriptional regulator [Candidatus Halocynthiibacter alkanivorans]|jgi:DNA-binding MarR family transcriptional regulator|uniref:MarR family winged helix-turn-helix transcriptional regulator n=1 Tax=Candidatus Halocynthiibacter alkanivorans TaxID=2267619 RepID=UPI000DF2B0EF|nr:MarR family transcriptional regulator [Candidatus Halocynthiibacter alkanivorans]
MTEKNSPTLDRAELVTRQWHRQLPDLDLRPMAMLGRLNQASMLIMRDNLEPVFKSHGLVSGEFDVLSTLRRAGAPYALTPTELFESTMITSGGMTARLDRLEKRGLLSRAPNPNDRRGTIVSLTADGKDLLEAALADHVVNLERIAASLNEDEQKQLSALLAKLIKGL